MSSPNIYFDQQFNCEASKILPGEYYVTKRDMVLVTVLGSCVAACIRDKKTGIGGMNHFMLPFNTQAHAQKNVEPISSSTRYGSFAMEVMINQILKLGGKRGNLEAKLFGGAAVIKNMHTLNIGQRNAEFALDYLRTDQITIAAQDLQGELPRKVYFFPHTGRVLVKKLNSLQNQTILEREHEYSQQLKSHTIEGDIELFI